MLLVWIVSSLTVLSLSKCRLPFYVLPAYSAVALWFGAALSRPVSSRRARRSTWITAVVSAIVIIALKGTSAGVSSSADARGLYRAIREPAGERGVVVLLDPDSWYGLQFYLGRRLLRARSSGAEPPGTIPAAAVDDSLRLRRWTRVVLVEPSRSHPAGRFDASWEISVAPKGDLDVVAAERLR